METTTELPESIQQIFAFFILLLCLFSANTGRSKDDPISTDLPTDQESDWDEFGLCSRLTVTELKSFKGCEHYTDEEAEIIIEGLYKLSLISYNAYCNYKNVNIFISK